MNVLYYASMLRCWHLVWILVRTDHPCLGVGCHTMSLGRKSEARKEAHVQDKRKDMLHL
jgi:hypothetical protein